MEMASADDAESTRRRPRSTRGGFSIVEVMVVLTVTAVMIRMALPSFYRSVEKAKADIAIANLRAVWAAQQFYWIENRTFTSDFDSLNDHKLIPPDVLPARQLLSPHPPYSYSITNQSNTGFAIQARRVTGSVLTDYFQIDQTGTLTGSVTLEDGFVIQPPTAY